MDLSELFWNASLKELKNGYIESKDCYICLLCGIQVEKGLVYPRDGLYYEAARYISIHIAEAHQSVFAYLINLDKKLTGLTEHQNSLLKLFYQGKSDSEVQQTMGIGSASTIRNHRFVLKEKERQAKVFLTLMELLKEQDKFAPSFLNVHKTARMIDERYNITEEEQAKLLKRYFPDGTNGYLTTFALKEKHKLIVLQEIAKRFQAERVYNEKEINAVLQGVYDDYVVLRRYLIEYGFLDRTPDGSKYWLKQ